MNLDGVPVLAPVPLRDWVSRQHRAAALAFACARARSGVWVEAGVADGWSTRRILDHAPDNVRLHAFDSFQGLPADWGDDHPAGTFAVDSPPTFQDKRVTVHAGDFRDTLPSFCATLREPVRFVHVDCDLYDSTMTVLRALTPHLPAGAIIAFDEAIGRPEALEHEARAIHDWQHETNRTLKPIARTNYTQLVMEVTA